MISVLLFCFVGLWSWSADKLHVHPYYEIGFYKLTVLKVHPPISRITAHAAMPGRLEHSNIAFYPNE
jgi:hypothetical protein